MTRRAVVVLLAVLALVVGGACDVPTNDQPVELTGPFAQLETTTTTSTTEPSTDSKNVVVYMLARQDGTTTLTPVPRSVDIDAGIQEVLSNLFSQPPSDERPAEVGLQTAIPESAVLLSAQPSAISADRLIIDVRGLIGSQGIQAGELRNALAQIVWTATEPAFGIREVVFRNDGAEAGALVDELESTDDPVDRSDYSRQS